MRFSTVLSLALPLLAAADSSTTTLTSTQTQTRTITISEVVASVTSTYSIPHNTTSMVGTASSYYTYISPSVTPVVPTTAGGVAATPRPSDVKNSASSINAMYAGSAGMVLMAVAAML